MIDPDRIYFSDLPVDPELESLLEYDDLFDMIFDEKPDRLREALDCDDSDDLDLDYC